MDIQNQSSYWKKLSDYDITTAKHMFQTKRHPYCLFMCHLSIEKLLKSLLVKQTGKHPPFSHNLIALAKELTIELNEDQQYLLADLTEFNIEARYPEWKKEFYKRANKKYTQEYYLRTQKFQKWLKKFLKK
jgi:HEPN domain-containing protein